MPTPAHNVPFPFVLPPALLDAADRLVTTLVTLVDAIFPIAKHGSTPTFSDHAAQTLFLRLFTLVTTLIRISAFGIRAPATPTTADHRPPQPAAPPTRTTAAQRLPSRPGWLLAALPDVAPAIAADLRALLADPALTALLAAAPTLHRSLRPILRGLDLAALQPPPAPRTPPLPRHTPSNPAPPPPPGQTLPPHSTAPKIHPSQRAFARPNHSDIRPRPPDAASSSSHAR